MASEPGLDKIDHIVVLMMENRSFDHMLGYLTLEGGRADLDGLNSSCQNVYQGQLFKPILLTDTRFTPSPNHDWKSVHQQIAHRNGGFVEDFATVDPRDPGRVMGYYNRSSVPLYEFLATEFCVFDNWYASVPGPTLPNRLYAMAGQSDGDQDNKLKFYGLTTVFDQLTRAGVSWRYFCDDVPVLSLLPKSYDPKRVFEMWQFFEDVGTGNLPAVTWIDPNFTLLPFSWAGQNDDHPPADIKMGQALVASVYNALIQAKGRLWEKTLFIVTYDEHGGFFDHGVAPHAAPDDRPAFTSYGVRVPAFAISPWVRRMSTPRAIDPDSLFDHTSLIKTILRRFWPNKKGPIPSMGTGADSAMDLGLVLTEAQARTDCRPYSGPALEVRIDHSPQPYRSSRGDFQTILDRLRKRAHADGRGWRFLPPVTKSGKVPRTGSARKAKPNPGKRHKGKTRARQRSS